MNLQSIILLSIVLALFLLVGYRYIRKQKKGRSCKECNCGQGNCGGCA
ncbi:MAG: FeoB-associated Cys-rich membrane protein [Bacteroidaceae bacterium]|nr:FeoB-associated Cys-rich membrane protein [Bacteroidaceae bacterium]